MLINLIDYIEIGQLTNGLSRQSMLTTYWYIISSVHIITTLFTISTHIPHYRHVFITEKMTFYLPLKKGEGNRQT